MDKTNNVWIESIWQIGRTEMKGTDSNFGFIFVSN